MMRGDFEAWMLQTQQAVEAALEAWVPSDAPAGLGQAMRYGVLDGGKRLRPLLVMAASEAVQGHAEAALRAAVAVELIHAYSLVHDDMPCMDNDVLRRGKPTVHVQYGVAQAMLAGDAMQALAFEVLTPSPDTLPAAPAARASKPTRRACRAGSTPCSGVSTSKARACIASPASIARASPNFTCTVGLPRRSTSLSMQGMSSWISE